MTKSRKLEKALKFRNFHRSATFQRLICHKNTGYSMSDVFVFDTGFPAGLK